MALHSAMGCAQSAAAGGSCKSGAVSGGVSAFASPLLPGDGKSFSAGRLIGNAIIGAVASRLSGGKAENGALTAAFSYLFNEASSGSGGPGPSEVGAEGVRQVIDRYREQGYTIVDTEVVASLPGIDSRRRYDFVTVSKDTGGYVGVEVKASSIGIFRLDRQQVNFDTALLSTPSGALALDGGYRITGVRYEGVDITGNINARWQQGFLFRRLQLLGVQPDRTTAPR